MKQKMIIGSILAAAIIILTSFTSVAEHNANEDAHEVTSSPLFIARSKKMFDTSYERTISAHYLGSGESHQWINIESAQYQRLISKALRILNNNPDIVDKLLQQIEADYELLSFIHSNGLSISKIKQNIYTNIQNPEDLQDYL